ncbi:hypothetical protein Hs30E_15040 [Lactococcus hodotermopsidis]|uniref:Glycosyl transferase n=1 Tax=Pseudolactococcus hodotermopsidis TaxID=2709157 RepID=A0A6A0BE31_9LACT|nr:glycosyltransferase [Lactococcus hodotermopsidis]GFH42953.1 hypothetical protein Hs30E_15040 [Lactococcus hodotermopsidis]
MQTKQKINLISNGDSGYFAFAPAFLTNFFELHKAFEVTFYAFSDFIDEKYVLDMQKIADFYGQKVVYVQIDKNEFDYLKEASVWLERFPIQIYYSFLAGKYLPETVERAMYFDLDIIFLDMIADVYFQAFEGNYFIGVSEGKPRAAKDLTIDELRLGRLINAGVVIMDVAALRKQKVDAAYFRPFVDELKQLPIADYYGYNLTFFSDQGLMAYVFRDKIKVVAAGRILNTIMNTPPTGNEAIIHFNGYTKYHQSDLSAIFSNQETNWIFTYNRYKLKAQVILGQLDAMALLTDVTENLNKAIKNQDFSLLETYSGSHPWQRIASDFLFSFKLAVYDPEPTPGRIRIPFSKFFNKASTSYQVKVTIKSSEDAENFGLIAFFAGKVKRLAEVNVKRDEPIEISAILDMTRFDYDAIGISSYGLPFGTRIDIVDLLIERV